MPPIGFHLFWKVAYKRVLWTGWWVAVKKLSRWVPCKHSCSHAHEVFNYKRENQGNMRICNIPLWYGKRWMWFFLFIGVFKRQLSCLSEGWDLAINRHLVLPEVCWRSSRAARFLQHRRSDSSQKWEAANNGLAISVSLLVNRPIE